MTVEVLSKNNTLITDATKNLCSRFGANSKTGLIVGAISGGASWLFMLGGSDIDPAAYFGLMPVWPALCFGVAFCYLFIDIRSRTFMVVVTLVCVYASWYIAVRGAASFVNAKMELRGIWLSGLTGGALGSLGMVLTTALVLPSARVFSNLAICLLFGTVAGLSACLLQFDAKFYNLGSATMLVVWQAVVLACLAMDPPSATEQSVSAPPAGDS
jgi:hypothetical protein